MITEQIHIGLYKFPSKNSQNGIGITMMPGDSAGVDRGVGVAQHDAVQSRMSPWKESAISTMARVSDVDSIELTKLQQI